MQPVFLRPAGRPRPQAEPLPETAAGRGDCRPHPPGGSLGSAPGSMKLAPFMGTAHHHSASVRGTCHEQVRSATIRFPGMLIWARRHHLLPRASRGTHFARWSI